MPGRAKSEKAKRYVQLQAMCKNESRAVEAYNRELAAYTTGSGAKPSYRRIGERFGLDRRLLQRRQQGVGLSKQASNAQKSHLTEAEAAILIDFTIEMSYRGFPLDLKHLERHALEKIGRAHV